MTTTSIILLINAIAQLAASLAQLLTALRAARRCRDKSTGSLANH